jgi:hypothetical protein
LRERFPPFYGGIVTFVDAEGVEHQIETDRFDVLYDELHRERRLFKPNRWRLKLRSGRDPIYFNGMLDSLLRWARDEGLLGGQRDRVRDRSRVWFRNYVAHPSYHLQGPDHAVWAITDLAEIINRLWGAASGVPVRREAMVIAWSDTAAICGRAAFFQPGRVPATAPHVVVLADPGDPDLLEFDAQYDITARPCDYLWGPGNWHDAAAWLEREQPAGDLEMRSRYSTGCSCSAITTDGSTCRARPRPRQGLNK